MKLSGNPSKKKQNIQHQNNHELLDDRVKKNVHAANYSLKKRPLFKGLLVFAYNILDSQISFAHPCTHLQLRAFFAPRVITLKGLI